jgi:archaellum component FlaC
MAKNEIIKIIITIGVVLIAFGAGLWTGCGSGGEIKKQLDRSLELNTEAKNRISELISRLGETKKTITELRNIESELRTENQRIANTNNEFRNTITGLRESTESGQQFAGRTEDLIRECLQILQAEDNN